MADLYISAQADATARHMFFEISKRSPEDHQLYIDEAFPDEGVAEVVQNMLKKVADIYQQEKYEAMFRILEGISVVMEQESAWTGMLWDVIVITN